MKKKNKSGSITKQSDEVLCTSGEDIEKELNQILINEISSKIDQEILDMLICVGHPEESHEILKKMNRMSRVNKNE